MTNEALLFYIMLDTMKACMKHLFIMIIINTDISVFTCKQCHTLSVVYAELALPIAFWRRHCNCCLAKQGIARPLSRYKQVFKLNLYYQNSSGSFKFIPS